MPVLAGKAAVPQAEASPVDDESAEALMGAQPVEQAAIPSSSQIEVAADPINAWSDYALSLGAELMQKCRTQVLQELGYTCSAGVARNKVSLMLATREPDLILAFTDTGEAM